MDEICELNPNVEVECLNQCGAILRRGDAFAHISHSCPLALIACDFGCNEMFLRSKLEHHNLVFMIHHNNLLVRNHQNLIIPQIPNI